MGENVFIMSNLSILAMHDRQTDRPLTKQMARQTNTTGCTDPCVTVKEVGAQGSTNTGLLSCLFKKTFHKIQQKRSTIARLKTQKIHVRFLSSFLFTLMFDLSLSLLLLLWSSYCYCCSFFLFFFFLFCFGPDR